MAADLAPLAKISHAAFHRFLAQQPWSFWAIDSSDLKPLLAYQPVNLVKLIRVLKSHYTYSDLYLFNAASTEEQIRAIDWRRIPLIADDMVAPYVITRGVGQPFLGIAGSLDAAQRGDVMILRPAHGESRLLDD
jgi:hypothetical protein